MASIAANTIDREPTPGHSNGVAIVSRCAVARMQRELREARLFTGMDATWHGTSQPSAPSKTHLPRLGNGDFIEPLGRH